ncbi:acyl-CoA dehydrogenase [Streptomyces roseifaciens]|uniref:acyl-CoA dehydrogenase n=1 Tax=Streptomyces roseifaciens TaxID=1488406 RepID=UPI0007180993|nr:acyl-CoA dehydrogenase [Streptomyces roseifaciens]
MTSTPAATACTDRAHALDRVLGDPADPGNPLGFAAVLAADERGEMLAEGEEALDAFGLNEEFVPAAFGGRLTRLDRLVDVMRTVYRRDPCLGLGYGASSFIAGVNVWTAGGDDHCRAAAALLRGGGRIAVAYHELAHGNDMAGTEFSALPGSDGTTLLLNGRKEVVTNLRRAEAVVVFARTSTARGSRSHSQVYVDKSLLPARRVTYLPRYRTTGMRGVQLGGVEFRDCPVPARAVLGGEGLGLETALRSFQVTRTTLAAMSTAVVETALDVTLRHVRNRRLYGRTAADLPHVRSVLTGAFADLLTADCFATIATRALQLLPAETAVHAQAVKYFVSKALMDAVNRLSSVLGAHFYLREGPGAIFQKLLRDLQPVGFGHAARAACQVSLLPQLPLLARRSWLRDAAATPAGLFRPGAELPPMDFRALALTAGGRESLSTSLARGLAAMPDGDGPAHRALAEHGEHFAAELAALAGECSVLRPGELSVMARSSSYDLTTRYVNVLVAAACFGTWREAWPGREAGAMDSGLADPVWAAAALHRLRAPLGAAPPTLPPYLEDALWERLLHRHEHALGYGLLPRTPRTAT